MHTKCTSLHTIAPCDDPGIDRGGARREEGRLTGNGKGDGNDGDAGKRAESREVALDLSLGPLTLDCSSPAIPQYSKQLLLYLLSQRKGVLGLGLTS